MLAFGSCQGMVAEPYPQSIVVSSAGLYAVGTGGGGGAAQLLPGATFEPIVRSALHDAPDDALQDVHRAVCEFTRDTKWRGTRAELLVARWAPPSMLWVSGVGMCEVCVVRASGVELVHRATSLAALQPTAHPDILLRVLGGNEPPDPARAVELLPGELVLLMSNVRVRDAALVAFVERHPRADGETLDGYARRLWRTLRARAGTLPEAERARFVNAFDRRAAIGVLARVFGEH